jgi:hypothetical protein
MLILAQVLIERAYECHEQAMRCLSGRNFSLVYYALEPNKLGDPVAWLPTCKCSYFQAEPRGGYGVSLLGWFPVRGYEQLVGRDPASQCSCQLLGCQCGRPSSVCVCVCVFFFFTV